MILVIGLSCWVSNNTYTVYEIPAKHSSNTKSRAVFLAKNNSFKYYLFGTMSIQKQGNREIIRFRPYGQYSIKFRKGKLRIKKKLPGRKCTFGADEGKDHKFKIKNKEKRR